MSKKKTTENRWVITDPQYEKRELLQLKLKGFKVSRSTLGSGSILLFAERSIKLSGND